MKEISMKQRKRVVKEVESEDEDELIDMSYFEIIRKTLGITDAKEIIQKNMKKQRTPKD